MNTISTQALLDSFKAKFSITSNSAARFLAAFLSAYNDSLMDLYNAGVIEEPTLLTAANEDSDLTENYLPIIKTGIINYLQQAGEWVKGDSRDEYAYINWQRRIGEAANLKTAEDQTNGAYTGPWGEDI